MYILRVFEDGETYDYEYPNLKHALEMKSYEKNAVILEYRDGNLYLTDY